MIFLPAFTLEGKLYLMVYVKISCAKYCLYCTLRKIAFKIVSENTSANEHAKKNCKYVPLLCCFNIFTEISPSTLWTESSVRFVVIAATHTYKDLFFPLIYLVQDLFSTGLCPRRPSEIRLLSFIEYYPGKVFIKLNSVAPADLLF